MIYSQNRLYFVHLDKDFAYSFSPLDALHLCLFKKQHELYLPYVSAPDDIAPAAAVDVSAHILLNSVNLMPPRIEVQGSHVWKEKDMSKVKDLTTLEKTLDWSFSTPYKGTLISGFKTVANTINEREV
jgi:hypothetical protein